MELGLKDCKIVCLCGSTRFKKEFGEINRKLTLLGHIILAPGVFGHSGDISTESQKKDLDNLHYEKIDMADCVFVVNVDGYIGKSTKNEIEYANNKPVFYLNNA